MKTSTSFPFYIISSLFSSNRANSNLMSIKDSNGNIIDSTFIDNKATDYSNNIFMSFSSVNVTNCKFDD
jgi:hypothetical protein